MSLTGPTTEVALKIHRRGKARDGRREFYVVGGMAEHGLPTQHVAVPSDAFETRLGHVCLAYKLHGQDLTDWNTERGRNFSPSEAREIARQVLEFFAAFHPMGAAHTDIKPENILYDLETESSLIIDFGNAERFFKIGTPVGTREYTPPEAILGCPWDPKVDIWSLGCTLFEMLTGELLFDPHQAASEKYIEFSDDDADDDVESASSSQSQSQSGSGSADEGLDDDNEECDFAAGNLVAGKYRLNSKLGTGHFATVWRATVENPGAALKQIDRSKPAKTVANHPGSKSESPRPVKAKDNRRRNQRAFGVTDAFDLALNYEHLLLMQRLLGEYPPELARAGIFHRVYCSEAGRLKFDTDLPALGPVPAIAARLEASGLAEDEAERIEAFLLPMLRFDIGERATAADCLEHKWLLSGE